MTQNSDKKNAGSSGSQPPLPEANLKTFISGIGGQALISLGIVENPATGKMEKNLDQAKFSIDLLQLLRDRMKGNLDEEETRFFDAVLFDLRMRYVEICRANT